LQQKKTVPVRSTRLNRDHFSVVSGIKGFIGLENYVVMV
jgi:hypothetical protein